MHKATQYFAERVLSFLVMLIGLFARFIKDLTGYFALVLYGDAKMQDRR